MNSLNIERGPVILFIVAFFFSLFCAALISLFPAKFVLIFMATIIFVLMAPNYPAVCLGVLLAVTFGFIPEEFTPGISLGGAMLRAPELGLLFMCPLLLIKSFGELSEIGDCLEPVRWPLLMFLVAFFFAFFQGYILHHYQFALADMRIYFAWVTLVTSIIIALDAFRRLHNIATWIAVVGSIALILQLLTGISILGGARGSEALSADFSDVVRGSVGGGIVFVAYSFFYFVGRLAETSRLKYFFMVCLLLLGIAATFGRGIWIATIGAAVVFVFLYSGKRAKISMIFVSMLAIACLSMVPISILKPRVADAVAQRIFSITEEGGRGSSVGFRFDENVQALAAIKKNPVLGMGLGGEYKVYLKNVGRGFVNEVSFVHNAYLHLWVKFGIFGLMYPVLLLWVLCLYIIRLRSRCNKDEFLFSISAFCSIVMSALYGGSSPQWSQFGDIASMSVMIAIILACKPVLREARVIGVRKTVSE